MKLKVIYKNGVPFAVHNEKEYRFELEKDDWQSEIKKVFPRLYNSGMDKDFIRHTEDGFMENYKAAQSKGCFTEEDMKRAIEMAQMLETSESFGTAIYFTYDHPDEIINSLKQPKELVAIDVEAFPTRAELKSATPYFDKYGIRTVDVPLYPHISKSEQYPDGLLTIKQYFYE